MEKNNQSGFSLIELLLVVTIIGIISAIGIPSLRKGIRSADNSSAFGTMRTIATTQVGYYSSNNRFARLNELSNTLSNLGTPSGSPLGTTFTRGKFLIQMIPLMPTDDELKVGYIITATGPSDSGTPFVFKVSQTGEIVQITP